MERLLNPAWNRRLRIAGIALLAILVLIQFVPVELSNPPGGSEPSIPGEVHVVLKRCCYDCHSNNTVWPWYSRVAPVSWLLAYDVKEGRKHLNFSTWAQSGAGKVAHERQEILEMLEADEMPPGIYTLIHRDAKLSPQELSTVQAWASAR